MVQENPVQTAKALYFSNLFV